MDELSVKREDMGKITVLYLRGEIGIDEIPPLRTRFNDLVDTGRIWLILDMEETTYLGSSGLGLLLALYNGVKERNGEIKLASPNQLTRDAMHFFGLIPILEVHDSTEAALAAFPDDLKS
ncbi:MAG: STAS domain-containing protein [Planctomycetes bacterium]|nr:STAS domain-containing protein [Planctomycetota bacterium]